MKHYQKADGSVWAFEADGSQDHLIPEGFTAISDEELAVLRAPTPEQRLDVLVNALQTRMDAEAHALGYDDLKTAITYRGDPNPKFAAEAEGFFVWRSAVWTDAYARLASGDIPASVEDALAAMPELLISIGN
jgi:hypothetical protein